MPKTRRARIGAGALILSVTTTAAALTLGPLAPLAATALAQVTGQPTRLSVQVRPYVLAYGHKVLATGRAPASDAGQTFQLDFEQAGSKTWRPLAYTRVERDGEFRLVAGLERSGQVKVTGGGASPTKASLAGGTGNADASSAPMNVRVGAGLEVPGNAYNRLGGGAIQIRGRLLPAGAGRHVQLQARGAGPWHPVAAAVTGPRGGFGLRYNSGDAQQLRVVFGGDELNGPAQTQAAHVNTFRAAGASMYDDGGDTGCGFHAYYGVANRDLPCGTNVKFVYHGKTVNATVDDRGPFVDGRDWDLNQNVAAALGFDGVDTVLSSR